MPDRCRIRMTAKSTHPADVQAEVLKKIITDGEVSTGGLYRDFYIRVDKPLSADVMDQLDDRMIRLVEKPAEYDDGGRMYVFRMEQHEFGPSVHPPASGVERPGRFTSRIIDPKSAREYMRQADELIQILIQTNGRASEGDIAEGILSAIKRAGWCLAGNGTLFPREDDEGVYEEPAAPGLGPDLRSAREYLRRAHEGVECGIHGDARSHQSSVYWDAKQMLDYATACLRGFRE